MTARFPTVESTQKPLLEAGRTFHPFSRLPVELRVAIWERSMRPTPTYFNLYHNDDYDGYCSHKDPAILQVNKESRDVGLKHYKLFKDEPNEREYEYYLNPDLDVLLYQPDNWNAGWIGNMELKNAFPTLRLEIKTIAVPAGQLVFLMKGDPVDEDDEDDEDDEEPRERKETTPKTFKEDWPALKKLLLLVDVEVLEEGDDEDDVSEGAVDYYGYGWEECRDIDEKDQKDDAWTRAVTGFKHEDIKKFFDEAGVEFKFVKPVNVFHEAEKREADNSMAWTTDDDIDSDEVDDVIEFSREDQEMYDRMLLDILRNARRNAEDSDELEDMLHGGWDRESDSSEDGV